MTAVSAAIPNKLLTGCDLRHDDIQVSYSNVSWGKRLAGNRG
jgi:hypothetical protein